MQRRVSRIRQHRLDQHPTQSDTKPRLDKKRFRHSPKRETRANEQKLYFLDQQNLEDSKVQPKQLFKVSGTTANMYEVVLALGSSVSSEISEQTKTEGKESKSLEKLYDFGWSCSCPDHCYPCKHIYFVARRVLGTPTIDTTEQTVLTQWQIALQRIVSKNQRSTLVVDGTAAAPEELKRKYEGLLKGKTVVTQRPFEGDECPVCMEVMNAAQSAIAFCETQCGSSFHIECQNMCIRANKKGLFVCPMCRAIDDLQSKKKKSNFAKASKYVNLLAD